LEVLEGDELYSFITNKKQSLCDDTGRENDPLHNRSWRDCVVESINEEQVRRMIWRECPSAKRYYNDACPVYDTIGYPGEHESLPNKSQTYSVEEVARANPKYRSNLIDFIT